MTNRKKGILFAVTGGIFWGGSGVAGQYLQQDAAFTTDWIVAARLLLGGLLLLTVDAAEHRGAVFSIWKKPKDALTLIFFGVFGLMLVSYSYFASIRYGNAAAATVLQYTMPAFIVLYTTLRYRRLPARLDVFCVLLAFFGTFLLVTHGNPHALSIPFLASFWGIVSAITGAIYTLSPKGLIRAYRATLVVGWGMLVGGIAMLLIARPPLITGIWTPLSTFCLVYLILFGTAIAFGLYLGSTKFIAPGEAGVLASVEPLTAILLSVFLLHADFGLIDTAGSACILLTVLLLARK